MNPCSADSRLSTESKAYNIFLYAYVYIYILPLSNPGPEIRAMHHLLFIKQGVLNPGFPFLVLGLPTDLHWNLGGQDSHCPCAKSLLISTPTHGTLAAH